MVLTACHLTAAHPVRTPAHTLLCVISMCIRVRQLQRTPVRTVAHLTHTLGDIYPLRDISHCADCAGT